MRRLRKPLMVLVFFLAAIGVAAMFDLRVSAWVHAHELKNVMHRARWPLIAKWPGHFGYCTLPVAIIVGLMTGYRWRGAALVVLSGVFAGLFYTIAKWCAG